MAEDGQVRVILWCIPRTISTAFLKCMSNLEDVQIISEPYDSVYYYGPDRANRLKGDEMSKIGKFYAMANEVQIDYSTGWNSQTATYTFIQNMLGDSYPGKKVVFVKDMSHAITGNYDKLPQNFRHAFLIRNPVKLFPSWKKMKKEFPNGNEIKMDTAGTIPENYGYGDSLQLYEYLIKTGTEKNPVIIDSDDLLDNPESILRMFCEQIGIKYTDRLLSWKAGEGVVKTWKASTTSIKGNRVNSYYKDAFASSCFNKPKPEQPRSELDDDVNACIDATLPYYKKMYALRLIPDK